MKNILAINLYIYTGTTHWGKCLLQSMMPLSPLNIRLRELK